MFASMRRFKAPSVSAVQRDMLAELARYARRDVLRMTTGAGSGHPGGSLSSLDAYLLLLAALSLDGSDSLVVSHGHTAAGLYAALARMRYFDPEAVIAGFRKAGSIFEGHPSIEVPGVTWLSGALGQGLSVGCGYALAAKKRGTGGHVYVVMGDGEQAKGQLFEARIFAAAHGLHNLTAVIDCNSLQASGPVANVLPFDIGSQYRAAGWAVLEVDGHDFAMLYDALRTLSESERPGVLLARTVMGKGVPKREGDYTFHGTPLSVPELKPYMLAISDQGPTVPRVPVTPPPPGPLCPGPRIVSAPHIETDMRSAFGAALYDIIRLNRRACPVVLDCDLRDSLKLSAIARDFPEALCECGIAEQNAATMAAAAAKAGLPAFWADFGVFAIGEVYSQLRMGDINRAPLKLLATHCGLDVGEDGKTHQCLDYLSLLANLRYMTVLMPVDPNQADAMTRYAAVAPGPVCVCMGRSKTPVLADDAGGPLFGAEYAYTGDERGVWLRRGKAAAVVTMGGMAARALAACESIDLSVYAVTRPGGFNRRHMAEIMNAPCIVTYEDHFIENGLGCMVGQYLQAHGYRGKFSRLGVKSYGISASPEELYRREGLDTVSLIEHIQQM